MHIVDSLGRVSAAHWQDLLIQQHILPIGHMAWRGFLHHGLGMVTCDVHLPPNQSINWHTDNVSYHLGFIPQLQIREYLSSLELSFDTIVYLEQNIKSYNPSQEIIILINGNCQINLNRLQNLKIAPVECYQQVENRWSEFEISPINYNQLQL